MAIRISGTNIQLREILLREKPPELLAASPKSTVPVLIDGDGRVFEESLDIMHWALEKNDPEHWLRPENGDLAQMDALILQCEMEFKPHLDRYKYANRYQDVDERHERQLASNYLWLLDRRLSAQACLFGSQPSLADIAIFTFVRQFANVDRQWFNNCEWANLQNWLVKFLDSKIFTEIMQKYPPWRPGDPVTYFGAYESFEPPNIATSSNGQ